MPLHGHKKAKLMIPAPTGSFALSHDSLHLLLQLSLDPAKCRVPANLFAQPDWLGGGCSEA